MLSKFIFKQAIANLLAIVLGALFLMFSFNSFASENKKVSTFQSDEQQLPHKKIKLKASKVKNNNKPLFNFLSSDSDAQAIEHSQAIKQARSHSYTVRGKKYQTLQSSKDFFEEGHASWYGNKFHGRKTASGEIYDMYAMTAAHTRLPFGTNIEVTNLSNGKKVILKVNDRGPFAGNRVLDVSREAAKKLGMLNSGSGRVSIRALQ